MKKQNRVVFFNMLSTVLLRGISIFTAPLFGRLLGDANYGVVSLYLVWVSVVQIAFTMQSQSTLVNARIEYPEERQKQYQSSVITLSACSYLCFALLTLLALEPLSRLLKLEPVMIGFILFHGFGGFCILYINSKFTYEFKAGLNCLVSVAVPVITLLLSLLLVVKFPPEINYYGRILALAIPNGLIGLGFCIYILWSGKTFYNREFWRFCLGLSLPLVFYNLSDLVLGQCDRIMLQRILSEASVGQYSMAYNFGGILFAIFAALNNSWCPFFFEDMKQGRAESMGRQAKNFLELFTVLALGFIFLSREVYHGYLLASPEFWPGTGLIPIFAASYFFNFLCTFPVNFEYYHKKTKAVAVITVVASLVNIGLNYVLIRAVGMSGAAIATAISHGLQLLTHYLYCRYVIGTKNYPFPVKMWIGYLGVYAAGLVLVLLTSNLWWLRWGLGALIGLWELGRIMKRKSLF